MSIEGLKYYLNRRGGLFFFLSSRGMLNWMPDQMYLKKIFQYSLGYKLDLDAPKTFNEKLQWLKLYDRKPLYTQLVDKFEVRRYVAEKLGESYLIPLIGGPWGSVDEIDFDALPDQFVLKCTHDSGGVIVCRDKAALDIEAAKKKLTQCLKRNYYWSNREWPYKDVKPRIIAEEYLEDESGELRDYKVMCFDGVPKLIQLHKGRFTQHTQDFYNTDWNRLDLVQGSPLSECIEVRPVFLDSLLDLSSRLSSGFTHVRLDWYSVNGRLYFGEITFYDASGFEAFNPPEYDRMLGDMIDLGTVSTSKSESRMGPRTKP